MKPSGQTVLYLLQVGNSSYTGAFAMGDVVRFEKPPLTDILGIKSKA